LIQEIVPADGFPKARKCRKQATFGLLVFAVYQWLLVSDSSRYGSRFIENLARDIKLDFPDAKGYSVRNLRCMRKFAELAPDEEKCRRRLQF
jgi:ribosomal protein L40E